MIVLYLFFQWCLIAAMTALTRKQQDIMEFLLGNQQQFPRPPSLNELCQALGLKSRGSLHLTLQGLIEAGYIEAMGHKHRGVRLTEKALCIKDSASPQSEALPFVGVIAAGNMPSARCNASNSSVVSSTMRRSWSSVRMRFCNCQRQSDHCWSVASGKNTRRKARMRGVIRITRFVTGSEAGTDTIEFADPKNDEIQLGGSSSCSSKANGAAPSCCETVLTAPLPPVRVLAGPASTLDTPTAGRARPRPRCLLPKQNML